MPNQDWSEMRTTILGRSGLQVSRIAFGTWQLGGDWGAPFDEDAAVTAIRTARESGAKATATPVTGPAPEAM
jgi:aryl-alcohol dehydrogenase-like predicted oxidoreductase